MKCEECGALVPSQSDPTAPWQADYSLCVDCMTAHSKPKCKNGSTAKTSAAKGAASGGVNGSKPKASSKKDRNQRGQGSTTTPAVTCCPAKERQDALAVRSSGRRTKVAQGNAEDKQQEDAQLHLDAKPQVAVRSSRRNTHIHSGGEQPELEAEIKSDPPTGRSSRRLVAKDEQHNGSGSEDTGDPAEPIEVLHLRRPPQPTIRCQICPSDQPLSGPLVRTADGFHAHVSCARFAYDIQKYKGRWQQQPRAEKTDAEMQVCTRCGETGAVLCCAGGTSSAKCLEQYHPYCATQSKCTLLEYQGCTAMLCQKHSKNVPRALSKFKPVVVQTPSICPLLPHRADTPQMILEGMQAQGTKLRLGTLSISSFGEVRPPLAAHCEDEYLYLPGFHGERLFWGSPDIESLKLFSFSIEPDLSSCSAMVTFTVRSVMRWPLVSEPRGCRCDSQLIVRTTRACDARPKWWPLSGQDFIGLNCPIVAEIIKAKLQLYETRRCEQELQQKFNPSGAFRLEPHRNKRTAAAASLSAGPRSKTTKASRSNEPSADFFGVSQTARFLEMQRSGHLWVQRRSKIEGWGLCALNPIEKGTFIIEYMGELIRSELTDMREQKYDAIGKGCYMFRLDDDWVVDATMKVHRVCCTVVTPWQGNAARFVNHSCEPNCVSLIVDDVFGVHHIVLAALRDIEVGEELCYDYKFAMEDAKIPCRCGSAFCRTVMN